MGPPMVAFMARFDRKRLFVATMLIFALSNLLAALAPVFWVAALARFIPALMHPVFWALASEAAVNVTGPERAGKAIFMLSFGLVASAIVGIPMATLLADSFSWRVAFVALAVLPFLKAILLFFYMPAIAKRDEAAAPMLRQMAILRDPLVAGHTLLSLLVFAGMFTSFTYLADILERLGGFSGADVGWILMGYGAVGLIGNWAGGKLVDRSPLGSSIVFSVPLALAMAAVVAVLPSKPLLAVVLAVWGIAQPAIFTVAHVRLMKAASANPALGASLNISGANMGIGLGALAGGRVIDVFGLASVGWAAAGVMVLGIAATLVLMGVSRARARTALSTSPGLEGDHCGG
jgi:predicted MFS family arabinose efflux permease